MSENTPPRIDWNGEGNEQHIRHVLKPRYLMRKAAAPAAIGLVGLALIGAIAVGPVTRSMMTPAADSGEIASVQATTVASGTVRADAGEPVVEPAAARTSSGNATAARMVGADASVGLAANDPRWSEDALPVDEGKLAELKKAVDETVAAAEIATTMDENGADRLLTSGLPAQATGFAPERPAVASRDRNAFDAALSGEKAEPEPVITSDLQPAKATQYVNMRSGPADDASVITVVPANAELEAETDCRWCEVSYDGQKGYIFQSFITR